MSLVESLKSTKNVLLEDGWVAGYMNFAGSHCLVGAAGVATGAFQPVPCEDCDPSIPHIKLDHENTEFEGVIRALDTQIKVIVRRDGFRNLAYENVLDWNDVQEDMYPVLDAVNKAIGAAEQGAEIDTEGPWINKWNMDAIWLADEAGSEIPAEEIPA